jgi:phage/plasmid-like protein (TIGR03299 family)
LTIFKKEFNMPAELARDASGRGQVFSYLQSMWHRDGYVIDQPWDYERAVAFVDYPLEKRPHYRELPDGTRVEADDSWYVYRPDTNTVLGSVGGLYELVPNREAFEPLRPLVDEGLLRLETGGVLRGGQDAWLLGQWDLSRFGETAREVLAGEVAPYATVLANHCGRRGVLIGCTPIRICCANTLGMAETHGQSRWTQVNHRAGAKVKLVEAAQHMFGRVIERYEIVAKQYKLLMATYLSELDFQHLVLDIVAPDPRDHHNWNPEARLANAVLERCDRKRQELKRLWREGKGHTGEPTAWYALNGVIEALDFCESLWPTRAGCYRTASLLTGELARLKHEVIDGLVQYAMAS